MSQTLAFSVSADTWTELASGPVNVVLQMTRGESILVHVGTAVPALDAPAIVLSRSDRELDLSGLLSVGDRVLCRSGTNAPTTVTIIRS